MNRLYLDYAATTPVKPEIVEAMLPYFSDFSLSEVDAIYKDCADTLARCLNAPASTITFTPSGSFSNNLLIKGLANYGKGKGKGTHILTTVIEHPAVGNVFKHLGDLGFQVEVIPVDHKGYVDLNYLEKCIRPETALVSVMMVNNELGTRQPIEAISRLCRLNEVLLHVDAVQALGNIPLDLELLDVDAMTFSAHKVYAPKGCGAHYIKPALQHLIEPLIYGEEPCGFNLPYIVGFARAVVMATEQLESRSTHKHLLKEKLRVGLEGLELGIKVNGNPDHPGILNVYIPSRDGDTMVINYDMYGIAISSGSACSSGALNASHVLRAIGYSEAEAKRCIRYAVGDMTTEEEIDRVIDITRKILKG
ncbi:MAG: cysteine desulfurase [Firmicutes bacterium]|nr:cysteine desulfurase [Bacillota bacterium]